MDSLTEEEFLNSYVLTIMHVKTYLEKNLVFLLTN